MVRGIVGMFRVRRKGSVRHYGYESCLYPTKTEK